MGLSYNFQKTLAPRPSWGTGCPGKVAIGDWRLGWAGTQRQRWRERSVSPGPADRGAGPDTASQP